MKKPAKNEEKEVQSILVALEQMSQTIDVMTHVVGRIRGQLLETENKVLDPIDDKISNAVPSPNETIH